MRLGKKSADFFGKVFLRGIQLPAVGLLQVLFRRRDIRCCALLSRGKIVGGERW